MTIDTEIYNENKAKNWKQYEMKMRNESSKNVGYMFPIHNIDDNRRIENGFTLFESAIESVLMATLA